MSTHHGHKHWHLLLGMCMHLIGLLLSGAGLAYGLTYISENGEGVLYYRGWPGKIKYLTFWNQMIQPAYFLLCLLNDVFGSNTTDVQHFVHRGLLQRLRDLLHCVLVYPLGMFVVCTFWGIYAVDRELVYPAELDKVIPVWHNQITHTSPLVLLLLEKIFVNITYPRKRVGLPITVSLGMLYQIWLLWMAYTLDLWVYPVLKVLDFPKRCVFLSMMWAILTLLYLSGQWLSKELWWGPTHHMKKVK